MYGLYTKFAVIVLTAVSLQVEHAYFHTSSAKPQGRVSQAEDRAQAQPGASAPPATAQTKPPDPIVVTYQDGQLTIDTIDAPLSEVLRTVVIRTGALINVPAEANERVTRHIGPGPVITVLGSLLNESSFNYLIEEFDAEQRAPVRVALTPKGRSSRVPQLLELPQPVIAEDSPKQPGEEADVRDKLLAERKELIRVILEQHLESVALLQKDKARP